MDTGAINRKLGSDMADSVTGGGLHGKDDLDVDAELQKQAFYKSSDIWMLWIHQLICDDSTKE